MARRMVGIVGGILLMASAAMAQSGGGYDLTWSSIDAGGGIVTGGAYTLASSIGQPDASAPVSGGSYSVSGGFLQDSSFFPVPVTVSAFSLE